MSLSSRQLGSLCALSAALLFSSKAIFIKQAYAISPLVDATVLMALRMCCALPFFLAIAWFYRHKTRQLRAQDWGLLVFAGLLGYYFASWLDFLGLMYISASLERIILFLYPTLTVLLSCLLKRQGIRAYTAVAIVLSYGGTVMVMLQEQHHLPGQNHLWLGASLVFASAVAFAIYLVMSSRLIQTLGSWSFTGLALSIACLGTLLHFLIATPQPIQLMMSLPHSAFYYGLALGLFVTVIPTLLLMQSIERLGAAQSAMIASIGPILTIILASIFLAERLNLIQWLGCMLNLCGVMMITLSKKTTLKS